MELIKRNIKSLFKSSEFEKIVFKAFYDDFLPFPKEKHMKSK
jgi:hypothetical protein